MTIADTLRAGRARLLERGWCQGDDEAIYASPPRKCCAATAICDDDNFSIKEAIAACDALGKSIGIDRGGLAGWNDASERTLEDVLAAYDRAIAAAEEIAHGHQE